MFLCVLLIRQSSL